MKRPFLWVSIAFLCGTLCSLLLFSSAGCFLAAAGFLASLVICRRKPKAWWGAVLSVFLFAGTVSGNYYLKKEEKASAWLLSAEELRGTVSSVSEDGFLLRVESPAGGTFYCRIYPEKEIFFESGMKLTVRGSVTQPAEATNPGQFDFRAYCRNRGILGQCNSDQIVVEQSAPLPYRWSSRLRGGIVNRAKQLFSVETAGIVIAMLTGSKENLPEASYALFRELGGAHVLAVSGMHMAILSGFLVFCLQRAVRKKYAYLIGFAALFFFGMLTGFPVSCVRALGGCLFLGIGKALGRRSDALTSLSVILFVCILLRPVQILDFGTQLSFGAAFSLAAVVPAFQKKDKSERRRASRILGLRQRLLGTAKKISRKIVRIGKTTLLVQLSLLPLELCRNYRFSPYSILLNCLLLLFISAFLFYCILTLLVSFFLPGAAVFFAALADIPVALLLNFCRRLLRLPFASVVTGKPELWAVLLFYLVLGTLALRCRRKGTHPLRYALLLLSVGLLFHCRDEKLIAFLDVGQGDCAVLLYKDTACVIDCGSSGSIEAGSDVLLPFLYYYGYSGIDLAVLSHLDGDHVNGLEQVLASGVPVKQLLLSDYGDGSGERWVAANGFSGIWHQPEAGESYGFEGMRFTVLWPEEKPESSENAVSLTVLLRVEGLRMLFPGDLEAEQLAKVAERTGAVDVLKVPHHGSRFSVDTEALVLLRPRAAVISCGRRNLYGHPHAETLEAYGQLGSLLHRTDLDGSLLYELEDLNLFEKK